jgi:adenylate cyclase
LFLNDPRPASLYSRVAQGNIRREIPAAQHSGIAGHVFSTGEPLISHEPYSIRASTAASTSRPAS